MLLDKRKENYQSSHKIKSIPDFGYSYVEETLERRRTRQVEGKKGRTRLLLLQQHYQPFVSRNHGTRVSRNNARASSNVEERIVLLEKKIDQLERMRNRHRNAAESETRRKKKNKGKIKQKRRK